jgi:hypothetical protein
MRQFSIHWMVDVLEGNMSYDKTVYNDYVIIVSDEKNDKKEILGEVSNFFHSWKQLILDIVYKM